MNWLRRVTNLWRGPEKLGESIFYPVSSTRQRSLSYVDAFLSIPEVNAPISLKARAFANGRLKIVDKRGKPIQNHKYSGLLENFNWFQPQKEFVRQAKLFHELFGDEYLYQLQPVGFKETKALFVLPSNLVISDYKSASPYFLYAREPEIEYFIESNGQRIKLDQNSIIHMNSDRVSFTSVTDKNVLNGQSKLESLQPAINNLADAYESRGVILRNRGAMGILSNDNKDALGSAIPLTKEDKQVLKEAYSHYGTLSHQSQVVITNVPLKWQPMQINPSRLGLFEECREDFDRILDTFSVPADLFTRAKGTTYENQLQSEKRFYSGVIIPEMGEWLGGLNQSLMEDDSARIVADYSHLDCFAEDKRSVAETNKITVDYLSRLLQDKVISVEEYKTEITKRLGIGDVSLTIN